MAIKTLLLIRHASYNGEAIDEAGRRQSLCTAERLRTYPVRVIHSSTMLRAVQTAEIIAAVFPGIPMRHSTLLCECIPSVPRNVSKEDRRAAREKMKEDRTRAIRAFARYFKPPSGQNRCEIVVCHGNIIRYMLARLLKLGAHGWQQFGTRHCGLTEIKIASTGDMEIVTYNDTGHLPLDLQSS